MRGTQKERHEQLYTIRAVLRNPTLLSRAPRTSVIARARRTGIYAYLTFQLPGLRFHQD